MRFSKLRVSRETTRKLRTLQQRARLTPNLLCRIGIVLSLAEGTAAGLPVPPEDGMEFNRYTLTGDLDAALIALLCFVERTTSKAEDLSDKELLSLLRCHIERGVRAVAVRVKSPVDVASLART